MRLSYLKPQKTSFRTNDWFWTTTRKPHKKWQANLKIFLFEKLKKWGWLDCSLKEQVNFVQVEIDGRSLLDLIRLQMDILIREGRRPAEVILGRREWIDLTHNNSFQSYLGFTWPPSQDGYPPLFGMKVRVVPYINGIVVLPEDK